MHGELHFSLIRIMALLLIMHNIYTKPIKGIFSKKSSITAEIDNSKFAKILNDPKTCPRKCVLLIFCLSEYSNEIEAFEF